MKNLLFSFHIVAVNAFRTFNTWDFLFTSKFPWFVLRHAKASLTSSRLRSLFDAWSKLNQIFWELNHHVQYKVYEPHRKPSHIIWQFPYFTFTKKNFEFNFQFSECSFYNCSCANISIIKISACIASPWGSNINVRSGKAPAHKIRGGISTPSPCWTTLRIISLPTILFQRSADCNRVELCAFPGAPTEAQINWYSASTSAIKTIEQKPLK